MNYFLEPPDGRKPSYIPGTAGNFRRPHDPHTVPIHDIRGHEADFQLDRNGFQLVPFSSKETEFTDTEQFKKVVYPEVADLLKNMWVLLPACLVLSNLTIGSARAPHECTSSLISYVENRLRPTMPPWTPSRPHLAPMPRSQITPA